MSIPTKEQMQALLKPKFGDVEIVCERPVFVGNQSMVSLGLVGVLCVYENELGKRFAVQIPFGVCLTTEKAA